MTNQFKTKKKYDIQQQTTTAEKQDRGIGKVHR